MWRCPGRLREETYATCGCLVTPLGRRERVIRVDESLLVQRAPIVAKRPALVPGSHIIEFLRGDIATAHEQQLSDRYVPTNAHTINKVAWFRLDLISTCREKLANASDEFGGNRAYLQFARRQLAPPNSEFKMRWR